MSDLSIILICIAVIIIFAVIIVLYMMYRIRKKGEETLKNIAGKSIEDLLGQLQKKMDESENKK